MFVAFVELRTSINSGVATRPGSSNGCGDCDGFPGGGTMSGRFAILEYVIYRLRPLADAVILFIIIAQGAPAVVWVGS